MTMTISIWTVAILLVSTKILDVLTTLFRINNAHDENNPFAQRLMNILGIHKTIFIVFIIAMMIIAATTYEALTTKSYFQIVFVIIGIFISIVQGAVAHSNWYGVENIVTKQIRKIHGIIGR